MGGDLVLAFLAGLISFISPCVLPLVPAYIGYMGGRMTKQVAAAGVAPRTTFRQRFGTLTHGLFFVAGFTLFFVIFGLITTSAISALTRFGVTESEVREAIARIGGTAVILFGLHVMGIMNRVFMWLMKQAAKLDQSSYGNVISALIGILLLGALYWLFVESWFMVLLTVLLFIQVFSDAFKTESSGQFWIAILTKLQTALYIDTRRQGQPKTDQYGYFGSLFMGVVFSAGWTPCIGPIYGSILIAASSGEKSTSETAVFLTSYALGLGIPFLLTALLLDQSQSVFRRLQRNMRTIEAVSGAFLILIGVLIFSGQMERLTQIGGDQGALGDLSLNLENCIVGAAEGKVQWGNVTTCISKGPKKDFYLAVSKTTPGGLNVPELGGPATNQDGTQNSAPLNVPALDAPTPDSSSNTDSSSIQEGLTVGKRAPDFTTRLLGGETVTLSDYRGQIVLLNFWATWCVPCQEEMPTFQTIYELYQEDGFVVLAINSTSAEFDQDNIVSFVEELGLTFPVGLDESGAIAERQYKSAVPGLPTSFLIDQTGVIRAYFPTAVTGSDLIAALDNLLDA